VKTVFVFSFEGYFLPFWEYLWEIPVLGVFVSVVAFFVGFPLAMSVLVWGAMLYVADFAVQSTVFLYAWQAVSWVVKDFKIVKGMVGFVLYLIRSVWENGRKVYYGSAVNVGKVKEKKL